MGFWRTAGAPAMDGDWGMKPHGEAKPFPPHLPPGGRGHLKKALSKGLLHSKEGLGKGS